MAGMDAKALSAIFAQARKKPVVFALLTGKPDMVFETHLTKSVAAVRKAAKANGGGPKGGWGTMRVSGNKVFMTCEEETYGQFEKQARDFFSSHGQRVQVIVGSVAVDGVEEGVDREPAKTPNRTQSNEKDGQALDKRVAERKRSSESGVEGGTPDTEAHELGELETEQVAEDGDARVHSEQPIDHSSEQQANDEDGLGVVEAARIASDEDELDEDLDENADSDLGVIIARARKRPMNFAWLLSEEDPILKAHIRKPIPALIKLARGEGASQRGAWGTLAVSGKVVALNCLEEAPGMFAKLAREQLKSAGFNFKVEVHGPASEVDVAEIESDEEDETVHAEIADREAQSRPQVDASLTTLSEAYQSVFGDLQPLLSGARPEEAKILKGELKAYKRAMLARDTGSAAAALERLRARVKGPGQSEVLSDETIARNLLSLEADLDSLLAELASAESESKSAGVASPSLALS